MIVKLRDGRWAVKDHTGHRVLGIHPTREAAVKQLQAVEISKHVRDGRGPGGGAKG